MSRFLREQYKNLEAYTPGEQPKVPGLIKLNTNENPYPPSPAIEALLSDESKVRALLRYPDPTASELIGAIATYYGLAPEQITVSNGSDEVLAFIYMAFGEKVYFPDISYGFYPVFAQAFMSEYESVPLTDDLRIDPGDYDELDGTIIIANPNAPTGLALSRGQIEHILKNNPDSPVVIDEAYVDFGTESCVPLLSEYDNLIIVQTLSKSRSLAGARIGIAMASEEIIRDINTMKYSFNPYNLDRLAIEAGAAAMKDEDHFQKTRNMIMATRGRFISEMERMGFEVLPSKANFVFARHDDIAGKEYYTKLRERAILVRHFDRDPIRDWVRITIGKDEDMDKLIKVTEEILCD